MLMCTARFRVAASSRCGPKPFGAASRAGLRLDKARWSGPPASQELCEASRSFFADYSRKRNNNKKNMSTLMQADPGEKSLLRLLKSLTATLHPTTYVFATLKEEDLPPLADIVMFFREQENATIITSLDYAEQNSIEYFFPCRMITLNVTSSLEAVGFLAVIASKLAQQNLGVNPVSAFFHDHLFIPLGREHDAMEILAEVAREQKGQ